MRIVCEREGCSKTRDLPTGHLNRSRAQGNRLFCSRKCAGIARRKPPKTDAQKKEEKRLYDQAYRMKNRAVLKAKKSAYFQRTYDPVKAAAERKKRMPYHVEYCRTPEYRAKKHVYDTRRYHEKTFGPLADVSLLLKDLVSNINERITDYESRSANQAVRNPQVRSSQESIRTSRDRNRSAQGNGA